MTRISTASMQLDAVSAMLRRQSELARTQNELTTGRRIRTAADDPAGAVQMLGLERALAAGAQYASNATTAMNRLQFEEQAFADITASLQRVQELSLQANNSVLDESSRRMIATELRSRVDELIDIANRRDAAGEYLFAGYQTATQPFARAASGVTFYGDGGVRYVALSATQRVADSHSGQEVFQDIVEGNGTFATALSATNTGSGVIDAGSLLRRPDWIPDDYTIRFTAPGAWEVVDGTATTIASGVHAPGASTAIEFAGVRVSISGAPAAGDEFRVSPAGRQDLFGGLDALVATVESSTTTPAERARFATDMSRSIAQTAQAIDHMLGIRAEIGSRLSAIDSANAARESLEVEMQRTLSDLSDVDYAEAISRLNQQLVGLQAAQQTYVRLGRLSLFDYL